MSTADWVKTYRTCDLQYNIGYDEDTVWKPWIEME
jgi:hypothetical protein